MDTSTFLLEALPLLIPIIGILCGPLIMYIWYRFTTRRNEEIQKTVRALIESGQPISSEIIERLTADEGKAQPANRRERDLRWGVILLALGIGIALFGILDNLFDPGFVNRQGVTIDRRLDNMMDIVAFASVFLLVGLARLALWKWAPDPKPDASTTREPANRT